MVIWSLPWQIKGPRGLFNPPFPCQSFTLSPRITEQPRTVGTPGEHLVWFIVESRGLEQVIWGPVKPSTNISSEGDSTSSLNNLCKCLIVLTIKNLFHVSRQNFSLCPLPLVLCILVKEVGTPPLYLLFRYRKTVIRSPELSLVQAERSQFFSNFPHMSTSPAITVALCWTLSNFSMTLKLRVDQNWTLFHVLPK